MDWLEFSVIIGCGLVGFIVISAVIDARRVRSNEQRKSDGETKEDGTANNNSNDEKPKPDFGKESPRSWWEVLGVNENATSEQIKSAFRKEISKYHPDRVEGLGIELRELAELKAKEVNQAYTVAKQQRRFN